MKNGLKKLLFLILLLLLQISVFAQSAFENLYKNKRYFDLRDELAKHSTENSPELLFYQGIIANRFNENDKSVEFLQKYLQSGDTKNLTDAYETLADDYAKTYRYGKSADVYKILLTQYKNQIGAKEKKDYENSFGLWNALRDAPPQKVSFDGDLLIQGKRDNANLLNLPVQINYQAMDFVFDTGANLSVLTVSTAQKLNLKIIESSVSVGSSTDLRVKSKLAVIPALKIGNVTVYNAVFLVLEDKSLFFPQVKYQINGIIGFPVIESLGNVIITRDNKFSVKAKSEKQNLEPNLCLDEFKPLIAANVHNRRMIFAFDTGAVTSTFYPLFFKADEVEILKTGKSEKMTVGGAGGSKEVSVYNLNNLDLMIAGKNVRLNKAKTLTKSFNDESKYFYGNLGQDLIKQFEKMTLDFKSMRITFE